MLRIRILLLLGLTTVASCKQPLAVVQKTNKQYVVAFTTAIDSNIVKILAPYKIGVDTQMRLIVGHAAIPLSKAQPESTLGNFMADAQLLAAQNIDPSVVVSIVNYGGIRIPYIPPGEITRGKLFELMPFDNTLTIVEIPGSVLLSFCQHMAKVKGWPVAGLSYKIKDKIAIDISMNGKTINENIVYKMVVSDYLAKGGDNCDFLSPLKKRYTSIFLRDVLIDYVTKLESQQKQLEPKIENRVSYAE